MTVRELIAMLSELPQDLPVVHSTGIMQDRETITGYSTRESGQTAWTPHLKYIVGPWIELI